MKKIDKNQLDSKINFNPKGSLVVPENANIKIAQPGVLMIATAGSFLYVTPPTLAKKDCRFDISESNAYTGSFYYFPKLEEESDKLPTSLDHSIVLYLKDNKPFARVCIKNRISAYPIELKLSAKQKEDFLKIPHGLIDHSINPELFNTVCDQVLDKTKQLNSSNFRKLGHISHKSSYIDLDGKAKTTDKNIEIKYFFQKDTEIIARPSPLGEPTQPSLYEARVFVRIPEEKTSRFRPENSDQIETVTAGYIFAEDLKSTSQKLKPSNEVLFKTKPHLGQTQQRSLPNCFLLAAISAILNSDDGGDFIMNMMKQDEEGVTVKLYEKDRNNHFIPVFIRIPNAVLYGNENLGIFSGMVKASSHEGGLWIHALEIAYVILGLKDESNFEKFCPSFLSSYGEGGHTHVAMTALTGEKADNFSITEFEYPKFNALNIFAGSTSFESKEQSPGMYKSILAELLPKESLLRYLFDNNEDDIILLIKAIGQKMSTDPSIFSSIYQIFNEFDDTEIQSQADFEAALRQAIDGLAKALQRLDPAFNEKFSDYLNIERPRQYGAYSFYFLSGGEFSGKYNWIQIKTFDILAKASQQQALLTAGTHSTNITPGLASSHAYTITRCYSEDKLLYINARNPWDFYSLTYRTFLGKMRRSRSPLSDISKIELGDFFQYFNAYQMGHRPLVPSLGLKHSKDSDLKHQLKVDQLQLLSSYTEAAFKQYGLILTAPVATNESDELSQEQDSLIKNELESHLSAFSNFIEQRIKILDSYYPYKKFVVEKAPPDSKIAILKEDKEAFSNEIDKLIDPLLHTEIHDNIIGEYLKHFSQSDAPASIKKYSHSLLILITHIRNLQKTFHSLKTTENLSEARFFSQQYLHHFSDIIAGIQQIQQCAGQMQDCKLSSASFFYPSTESLRNAQQMEIMSKKLSLLSPYVEFMHGKNLGEFFKEFKNTGVAEVQVIAAEIQRILFMVDSSIKININETNGYPVLTLSGVNQQDLAALHAAELYFNTDKIVHPLEYIVKPSLQFSS